MPSAVLYTLTVLIWGSTWYAITFQLGHVHPMLSIAYRFALAAVILFAFLFLRGQVKNLFFTRAQHGFIALQGFFLFCLNYAFNYYGTFFLTSGLVAIVFSTLSLMNVFNQAVFFKIPIKRQVVFGSVIGFLGIICVFWPKLQEADLGPKTLIGVGLVLVATYFSSLGNMVAIRNNRLKIPVIEGNTFGMLYGALFSFVIALVMGAPLTFDLRPGYVVSLLYLAGFGSALAFGMYLTLMNRIGADKAAYASVLFPIVALAISTVFEGYVWHPISLFGAALTLLGNVVAMANRERLLHWRENFDWKQER
jgi:drug/metabolite transporter (DMT)-like permease